ncbi:MAG TPA: ATP-binding protein, partial [candidate division Zixibacteria bacterium]|nr:ATP-binding protein [candidate division Zixibacteria bacterium]
RIQTINAAAERILGLREGEARGRFHAELMPRELAEAIAGPLVDEAGGEYREVTPAGLPDTPVLGIAASTVWDGEGEPIGAALLINDATEITQLREQLERRLRLAALGEMSGGLAHQLRNSLGAIAGYLNLLKRRLGKRGVEEPAVAELADEAAQAESLVRRFLEFARPLQADLQAVPLRDLIGQAAASFATREAYPRVEIAVGEIPEVVIPADPLLLRQALLNLIENAANAYSGAAGKIEIDAAAGNGETAIRVRDRACGIAPENVAKIFTPFYSSRPSGTGLGLALVSKIVDLHKGRIEVDSRVGRGSTFTITLPVGAPQPAAAEGPAEMRVRG